MAQVVELAAVDAGPYLPVLSLTVDSEASVEEEAADLSAVASAVLEEVPSEEVELAADSDERLTSWILFRGHLTVRLQALRLPSMLSRNLFRTGEG